jgi:hypothetical protein
MYSYNSFKSFTNLMINRIVWIFELLQTMILMSLTCLNERWSERGPRRQGHLKTPPLAEQEATPCRTRSHPMQNKRSPLAEQEATPCRTRGHPLQNKRPPLAEHWQSLKFLYLLSHLGGERGKEVEVFRTLFSRALDKSRFYPPFNAAVKLQFCPSLYLHWIFRREVAPL